MELLDYQLDDIRRALREYVEKNSTIDIVYEYGEVDRAEIDWAYGANERAALLELCRLVCRAQMEADA